MVRVSGSGRIGALHRWPRCGVRRMATPRPLPRSSAKTSQVSRLHWMRCSRATSTTWRRYSGTVRKSAANSIHLRIWTSDRSRPTTRSSRPGIPPHMCPMTSLEERTRDGAGWSRRQWAETTLAELFRQRLPAEANQAMAEAYAASERYISGYNIWMHHLVDAKGQRLFPAGKRLLSHWNLRDELKANYSEGKAGLAKQRTIQRVMERIVAQEIPAVVIDNPQVDWNPFTNAVTRSDVNDVPAGTPARKALPAGAVDGAREPDTRDRK